MNLYFDTSALVKRYIDEEGTAAVENLFQQAERILVSPVTGIEAHSVFRRLLSAGAIDENDYAVLKNEFDKDFDFFTKVEFDDMTADSAKNMIHKHGLRSLDSIQLGCASLVRSEIDFFVVCDKKLLTSAVEEGLTVINPSEPE